MLCSACLLGIKCRYDGGSKLSRKVIRLLQEKTLIPVCPEVLGGLSTPREPAEQKGGRVYLKSGKDVTSNFNKGAREVLKIAKLLNVKQAILKQKSPSCGYGKIYDGSFSGKIIRGKGIAASFLEEAGVEIITEEGL